MLDGVWLTPRAGHFTPGKETRYPKSITCLMKFSFTSRVHIFVSLYYRNVVRGTFTDHITEDSKLTETFIEHFEFLKVVQENAFKATC